jgi:hypothetical protein
MVTPPLGVTVPEKGLSDSQKPLPPRRVPGLSATDDLLLELD